MDDQMARDRGIGNGHLPRLKPEGLWVEVADHSAIEDVQPKALDGRRLTASRLPGLPTPRESALVPGERGQRCCYRDVCAFQPWHRPALISAGVLDLRII